MATKGKETDPTAPDTGEDVTKEAPALDKKAAKFSEKWLKGLSFATTEPKKEKDESGKLRIRHVPVTRPLEESDLLDWKLSSAEVVLVTKDGRKYRVTR